MDVLVYGAGAVGGYLGGRLAAAGHQVTLLARPAQAALISAQGLRISEARSVLPAWPRAVTSLADAFHLTPAYDLIIMAMKSYDLADALCPLADFPISQKTMIMGVQNGISVEEMMAGCFGSGRVLAGAVTPPISKIEANHLVVEKTGRGLGLAPVEPDRDISAWTAFFRDAGIAVREYADYRAMKWSKVFLNVVGNATSAILDRPPGELYRSATVFDLEMRMLREMQNVMAATRIETINLPGAPARRLAWGVGHAPRFLLQPVLARMVEVGRGDKMPSFHMDLHSGKGRSEVVFHNGAVAEVGRQVGVATPVNRALSDTLMRLTRGEIDPQYFAGQPLRLAGVVASYYGEEAGGVGHDPKA